jgi:hypothetical protein
MRFSGYLSSHENQKLAAERFSQSKRSDLAWEQVHPGHGIFSTHMIKITSEHLLMPRSYK